MSSGQSLRKRRDCLQTVNNDLNRCKDGKSIVCDAYLGPPSFWTSSMKVKLKRLANHRKGVRQHKLNIKIYKDQRTTSITGTSNFNFCTIKCCSIDFCNTNAQQQVQVQVQVLFLLNLVVWWVKKSLMS
jgi:hypothetical protein